MKFSLRLEGGKHGSLLGSKASSWMLLLPLQRALLSIEARLTLVWLVLAALIGRPQAWKVVRMDVWWSQDVKPTSVCTAHGCRR
jgi:hypothetical protein